MISAPETVINRQRHAGSGLFGHSAVYLGSESELRALGLWDNSAVVPHRDAIRAGILIIEPDYVFCTKLIDLALPNLGLPRRPTYGREVILPDDIALRAVAGRGIRLFSYLKADPKGRKVASSGDLDADIKATSEKD